MVVLDALALTFDEVVAAVQPKPYEIRPLRAAYRARLYGQPVPPPDISYGKRSFADEVGGEILPIVNRLEDGDLTKFVQRTHDGLEIESVVVPMQRTHGIWRTLCVSSQVGCARGCEFCETAQLGLIRNLTTSEIVGQVAAAQRDYDGTIRNIVFMGMGEPLDNYDNVIQAARVFTDPHGYSFGCERLTISTVGRTAGIRKIAKLGWKRLNLAISLNAPNDEIRSRIMPVNRLEPMDKLRETLLAFPLRKCQFFMMEYVLIPGVNDAPEHAREVAEYLRPLKTMLNVIPYNPRRDSPWPAPTPEAVRQFLHAAEAAGQGVKLRITKGREQMAACGQLGNRALARERKRCVEET
jgi:23S rRNA (adenine2503-C2)-methyltransferase